MQIEIAPRPASRRRAALTILVVTPIATLLLMAMIMAGRNRRFSADELVPALVASLLFGLILAVTLYRLSREGHAARPSTLYLLPEAVCWQPGGGMAVEIRYQDLRFAGWAGRGPWKALCLTAADPRASISIRRDAFAEPALAEAALAEIERHIAAIPRAEAWRGDLARRRTLIDRLTSGKTRMAWTLAAVAVLCFVVESAAGAFHDVEKLAALGANAPSLVAQGEWFRLATATFLHVNLMHLFANLWALYVLGRTLEPLLGHSRFLTVFLVSSLAGSALSAAVGLAALSVGASTGLYGLAGAQLVLLWRWPTAFPNPPENRRWLALVWLFVLPILVTRKVDNLAHLGGFAGGCLLMLLVPRTIDLLDLPLRHRGLFRVAAALLVALFLYAATQVPWVRSGQWRSDLRIGGATPAALIQTSRPL